GFNASDVMHIILGMVTLLLMILTMTFGAAALGRSFRIYTAISMAIFLVFGALTGMDSPRIKENLPTPMVGIWERINIGVFLIWVIVFAIIIMTMSMRTAHEKF
ncbi:MAG TPA: DUF998 domain-containing protein, partial [Puia sp.]|nr:DUF998 domain-containing protein [Puia sp.]